MGSSICGVSKTQTALNSLNSKIDDESKEKIRKLSDSGMLSSFEQNRVYEEFLIENGFQNPTQELIDYLKNIIRMNEKMEYVNHLGKSGSSPLFSMCRDLLPSILNEMAKVGTLHAIMSSVFDLLNNFWASLEKYHNTNRYPKPPTSEEMILELSDHFLKFIELFYPVLYKIAMKSGTKDELPCLTVIFDCLFGTLMGWSPLPSDTTFHKDQSSVFSTLSQDEQQSVYDYIDLVCKLAAIDTKDESEWPLNPIVDENLTTAAIDGCLKLLIKFNSLS
jgi:hypothetical protein